MNAPTDRPTDRLTDRAAEAAQPRPEPRGIHLLDTVPIDIVND